MQIKNKTETYEGHNKGEGRERRLWNLSEVGLPQTGENISPWLCGYSEQRPERVHLAKPAPVRAVQDTTHYPLLSPDLIQTYQDQLVQFVFMWSIWIF